MKLKNLNPLNKLSDGAIGKLANMVPDELIIKEVKKQWFKNNTMLRQIPRTKRKNKRVNDRRNKKNKV